MEIMNRRKGSGYSKVGQVDPKTIPARINTHEKTITNNMFTFAYE